MKSLLGFFCAEVETLISRALCTRTLCTLQSLVIFFALFGGFFEDFA